MPLVKNNAAAETASKFETPDDDNVIENGAATQTKTADERVAEQVAKNAAKAAVAPAEEAQAEPAAATSKSTAVAVAKTSAVSTSIRDSDPFLELHNALHVDYNTLTQIKVNQGNVLLKEGSEPLGDYVVLELLSFQDQWVCAPGGDANDEESKEFLRYSDDGVKVKDSEELLTDAVARAKAAGYEDARIQKRLIVVGALAFPGKDKKGAVHEELRNELVQIDLAPRSANNFNAFRINAAFKVGKNMLTAEAAKLMKMDCKVITKGKNTWTDAVFSVATDDDMK